MKKAIIKNIIICIGYWIAYYVLGYGYGKFIEEAIDEMREIKENKDVAA